MKSEESVKYNNRIGQTSIYFHYEWSNEVNAH